MTIIDSLGISFGGLEYKGCDKVRCHHCGDYVSHGWVIHDNRSGKKYLFCTRHYEKWEREREAALLKVAEDFRKEYPQEEQQ